MLSRFRNTFAEIDLLALEHNYMFLKSLLPKTSQFLAPMVKADAYGHGDIQVAKKCEELGAKFLGVALIEEGIRLCIAGIQTPILVFSPFDSIGAEEIVKYRLTPVLSQYEQIAKLNSVLNEDAAYPVHVKFNTGMQRLGFEPEDAARLANEFAKPAYLKLEGVCTHFAASEDFPNEDLNSSAKQQVQKFKLITEAFKQIALASQTSRSFFFHYLNSAGILSRVEPSLDLSRPGISLYGATPKLHPSVDQTPSLLPVMTVKTSIAFLHDVKKGTSVSYGGTWTAPKDSRVAVLPIGYADGYPRALSNKGEVLVRGHVCPVVGIVCMDYTLIDVTELSSEASLGDEVVLIGRQGGKQIKVEEVAEKAATISYEILTGIQARVPRIYLK